MIEKPFRRAGSAIIWQVVQLAGNKFIYFIRLLILARILVPEDFGLLAIAATAVGSFQNITNVGMTPALVQGQEVDDVRYDTAWTIEVVRALGVAVLTILTAPLIAQIFADPRSVNIIRLLALRPLLEASSSIKLAHLMWGIQFRPLTVLKLIDALVAAIVSILLASSWGVWALVAGVLAGTATSMLLSYFIAPHKPRLIIDTHSAKKLILFGKWIFLTNLIGVLGQYVLRAIISRQLGTTGLGMYFMASQLALLPSEVSSGVVGSVAFPLFARLQSDIQLVKRAFRTMVVSMAALLYPACLLIAVFAPSFVAEILGPKWSGTEPVIQILSLTTMIGIFGDSVVEILKGMGKADKRTFMSLIQAVTLITFVSVLAGQFGIVGAALAWLPAILVSQLIGIIFVGQVLPQPLSGMGRPILGIVISSLGGATVAFILDKYLDGVMGLATAGLAAVLFTILILWVINRQWVLEFTQDIVSIFPGAAQFIRNPVAKASK